VVLGRELYASVPAQTCSVDCEQGVTTDSADLTDVDPAAEKLRGTIYRDGVMSQLIQVT